MLNKTGESSKQLILKTENGIEVTMSDINKLLKKVKGRTSWTEFEAEMYNQNMYWIVEYI